MTLTNYWWLLIWLFTGGLALAAYFPKHREMVCGKIETRWGVVPAVLMAVPYIVWAGYRSDAFGDMHLPVFLKCQLIWIRLRKTKAFMAWWQY